MEKEYYKKYLNYDKIYIIGIEFNKKHKIIPKPIINEIHMTPEEILGKVTYEEEITKEELELFIKIEKDNL